MNTDSHTILPLSEDSEKYIFKHPGVIKILGSKKIYPLRVGDQTVGRKDPDGKARNADIAIDKDDPNICYMSRIHIHIVVKKVDNGYILNLWCPKESRNQTLIDGCFPFKMKGPENLKVIEKNQVIGMPYFKIRITDEEWKEE